jgi:Na+/proline symporter
MSTVDYVILGSYLVFLLTLGPVFNRFNRDASDYFRAGGAMVWWVAGTAVVMGGFSAWSFTGGAARVYDTGFFFLVLFACNFVAMWFQFVFLAAKFRQLRVVTSVEAIRKRFGPANEQVFTWIQVPQNLFFAGVGLYTLAVFTAGVFGLDMVTLIVAIGVTVTVMAVAGGAWAINAGQFVQSLIFLAITGVMVYTTLTHPAVGGLTGLLAQLPERHTAWTQIERPSVLLVFIATLLVNQVFQMNSLREGAAKYLIVKDGRDARRVAMLGIVAIVVLTPMWMIPPLGSVIVHPPGEMAAAYPGLNNPNEAAYIAMAQTTLPPGLLGLLICAIFSASLDNLSSGVNTSAAVLVRNFYIRVLNPAASERRQVWTGRVLSVLGGAAMIGVALLLGRFSRLPLYSLVLMSAAAVGLPQAVPMFLGLFVRRAPSISLWSTLAIGFAVSLALQFVLTESSLTRAWGGRGRGGGGPLSPIEYNDLKVAIITGVLLLVCVGWFFLCTYLAARARRKRERLGMPVRIPGAAEAIVAADVTAPGKPPAVPTDLEHARPAEVERRVPGWLGLFDDTPARRAQVDAFFTEMHTPIDPATEHGGEGYESDERQYRVLSGLCLAFGGFLTLTALVPNTLGGRLGLALCGGTVVAVGLLLRAMANRKARRAASAPPAAPVDEPTIVAPAGTR